ncbi:peptidylprolyl isomerase family protein [Terriglobus aquaticus]|uniref:Peptidylprolyl isomerase n=1 Tax=Terriglobus aquaticus TaxID=940139 RepID=A0ABW9KJF8_9BACT|nr:peptidylprolyl isomerase [Terriglobus aquaticus]
MIAAHTNRLAFFGSLPLLAALCSGVCGAQTTPATASATQQKANENKSPAERGEVVDKLVAIVNSDIILESDVDEEMRFTKLYPYRTSSGDTPRAQALTRLIDRDLILQQIRQPAPVVDKAEVDSEESDLRKDLPACQHADCKSDAGWANFLAQAGFTEDELRSRLQLRAEVLRFIEQRFRSGIRITDKQIEDFYTETMLPQYRKEHATPPSLEVLSPRIEELLLQQQVSKLLDQWLKSLRDSGNVRILKDGEEMP